MFDKARLLEILQEIFDSNEYSTQLISVFGITKVLRAKTKELQEVNSDLAGIFNALTVAAERWCFFYEIKKVDRNTLPWVAEEHLKVISEFALDISEPHLRALMTDILWVHKWKPNPLIYAKAAIEGYLLLAEKLKDTTASTSYDINNPFEAWSFYYWNLKRATFLAREIQKSNPECLKRVDLLIKQLIDIEQQAITPLLFRLMELLRDVVLSNDEISKYISLCERLAEQATQEGHLESANGFWQLCRGWYQQLKKPEKVLQCTINEAENIVLMSEGLSATRSSAELRRAYELYCSVLDRGHDTEQHQQIKQRRDEIYKALLEAQSQMREELEIYQVDADIGGLFAETFRKIQGKSWQEILFILAFEIVTPPDYQQLREFAEQLFKNSFCFNARRIYRGDEGEIVGKIDEDDVELQEKRLREADVFHLAQIHHHVAGHQILLVLQNVDLSQVSESDLLTLITPSAFIPSGREFLYAKGLYAGLTQDFVVSTHLLIPQLENSLRHLLKQQGVNVIVDNPKTGTQSHLQLETILGKSELEQMLRYDIVQDLTGLLIKNSNANLRNRVAHGLQSDFNTATTIYLWWLTLRLCLTKDFQKPIDA